MFQFAWVAPTETTFGPQHVRQDEDVITVALTQAEGDFAMLDVEIRNPRRYLLQGETNIWVWLAHDGNPIFFGRLIAIPESMQEEVVGLSFIARPNNYEATKKALADSLKVAPYWDKIWINRDREDDPDVVLEARPELYHIDRLTHVVTVSNIYAGEDGTFTYGGADIIYESLDVSYSNPPLRRVHMEAEVSWDQIASGTLEIAPEIIKAFRDAGSPRDGLISSYTAQGLEADWPENDTSLSGGWTVKETELRRADGVWVSSRYIDVSVDRAEPLKQDEEEAESPVYYPTTFYSNPITARFWTWDMQPVTFKLAYEAKRQRIEKIRFDLEADIQTVFSEPGEDEVETISMASRKISEPEVEPAEGEEPGPPIMGDTSTNAYLKTNRGRVSFEYLLMVARAQLLSRARAVEVSFQVPFSHGYDLTLRKSATVVDPRLPGGQVTGKIIGYSMEAKGGAEFTTVTIGCMVGLGNTVTGRAGTPTYVETGYVSGYQFYLNADYAPVSGEVTYEDYSDVVVPDFINFKALRPSDVIIDLHVINGETVQEGILSEHYPDIPAAVEALNASFTEVWLELEPVTGGPFETKYNVAVSKLMVPRTITL